MRLTPLGISILLILGSANVSAEFAGGRRDGVDVVRAYQMQGFSFGRGEPRGAQQAAQEPERRHGRADSSGSGTQGEASPPPDSVRKQGRLSPEERRALRRQIDEAGHEIYVRKR